MFLCYWDIRNSSFIMTPMKSDIMWHFTFMMVMKQLQATCNYSFIFLHTFVYSVSLKIIYITKNSNTSTHSQEIYKPFVILFDKTIKVMYVIGAELVCTLADYLFLMIWPWWYPIGCFLLKPSVIYLNIYRIYISQNIIGFSAIISICFTQHFFLWKIDVFGHYSWRMWAFGKNLITVIYFTIPYLRPWWVTAPTTIKLSPTLQRFMSQSHQTLVNFFPSFSLAFALVLLTGKTIWCLVQTHLQTNDGEALSSSDNKQHPTNKNQYNLYIQFHR